VSSGASSESGFSRFAGLANRPELDAAPVKRASGGKKSDGAVSEVEYSPNGKVLAVGSSCAITLFAVRGDDGDATDGVHEDASGYVQVQRAVCGRGASATLSSDASTVV
jgi:hypothetical protein